MTTLDIWRCTCGRILAERVVVGSLTAVCWGCGATVRLPEALVVEQIRDAVVIVTNPSDSPVNLTPDELHDRLVHPASPPFFDPADDAANLGSVAKKGRR